MIRSHEQLLSLINEYGQAREDSEDGSIELLATIDSELFSLYGTLARAGVLAGQGVMQGCRACDEIAAIISGERA